MKRLYFLRHAKSDRMPGERVADVDRPLNARGRQAAPVMGRYLRRRKLTPDLVVCSASRRTRETWELVQAELKGDVPVEFSERLYLATAPQILRLIRELPSTSDAVLLLGHNPGVQAAAVGLAGHGDAGERERLKAKFPTAGLAVIDFEIATWREVAEGSGRLERLVVPRDLG